MKADKFITGFSLALILLFTPIFPTGTIFAAELALLQGQVLDLVDKPLANAEVYVYNSPNLKRPADFISSKTGPNGQYNLTLLPGRYWVLAILRKSNNKFGPLGLEDKHSGDPLVLDLEELEERRLDFVVMDLREAALRQDKKNTELVRISGRVVDNKGNPVSMAYVAADKNRENKDIPAYISSWTDEQGEYTLFLPRGSFHLGASKEFPPASGFIFPREMQIKDNATSLNFVIAD